MSTENILTPPFRLAFPELFTVKAAVKGGREKFSITMLFPKNKVPLIPQLPGDGILELRKLAFAAIKEKWGADKAKWPAVLRGLDLANYVSPTGKDGWPIRDGDLTEWDGFAGCFFARATSQYPAGIVDSNRQDILNQKDVFGGLICRAQVNAFAYDNAGNTGISFGLSNLQILRNDGVMYGGREKAAEVFDAFGDEPTMGDGGGAADPFNM